MNCRTRSLPVLSVAVALCYSFSFPASAQAPAASGKQQAPHTKPPQAKNPVGPPVTVSQPRHYPILLIAQGTDPVWNLRLGMKGPERLERAGYPPIPLEPAEVEQETT